MPELTREEKLKLVEKLPQRLQDFLYSEDTGAYLLSLGQKHSFSPDKISAISKIVGNIILGITPLADLAQEIAAKAAIDAQTAATAAQELNNDLLLPALSPALPSPLPTPEVKAGIPTPPQAGIGAAPIPPMPVTPKPPVGGPDRYREPAEGTPEIIDLRKTPPPPMPAPVSAAPIPPISKSTPLTFTRPVEPIKPVPLIEAEPHLPAKISPEISAGKIPSPTPSPAPAPIEALPTLRSGSSISQPNQKGLGEIGTKPVMPPAPAEPIIHGADRYHEQIESPLPPVPVQNVKPSTPPAPQPQYIIRPPGLPPTDLQTEILDLRKDIK